MSFENPLPIFGTLVALTVVPIFFFYVRALRSQATRDRSTPAPDQKVSSKIRVLEAEKHELFSQWEESQAYAHEMTDRVRALERTLIDERRQRLVETEEFLSLRETNRQLEEQLVKLATEMQTLFQEAPTKKRRNLIPFSGLLRSK